MDIKSLPAFHLETGDRYLLPCCETPQRRGLRCLHQPHYGLAGAKAGINDAMSTSAQAGRSIPPPAMTSADMAGKSLPKRIVLLCNFSGSAHSIVSTAPPITVRSWRSADQ